MGKNHPKIGLFSVYFFQHIDLFFGVKKIAKSQFFFFQKMGIILSIVQRRRFRLAEEAKALHGLLGEVGR